MKRSPGLFLLLLLPLLWQCGGAVTGQKEAGLEYREVLPKSVLSSSLAESPLLCCHGQAGTRILGESGKGYILFDLGEEMVARIRVEAESRNPAPGSTLSLYYGETPEEALRREPYSGCDWYVIPCDTFPLRGGKELFRCNGRRGLRYLCVEAAGSDVDLRSVVAVAENYPVEYRGSFLSSDEELNRVWQMCAETARLCMQDYYEDGIKRDGLLWISDYRSAFLASWFAFGDRDLARKSLRMMAASQNENGSIAACCSKGGGHRHPWDIAYMPGVPHGFANRWIILNYCAEYVSSVHDYVMLTGDTALAEELSGSLRRMNDFLWSLLDFERPGQFWTDSIPPAPAPALVYDTYHDITEDYQTFCSRGALLFQLLKAWNDTEALARYTSDQSWKDSTAAQSALLREHIERWFRDPASGIYLDNPGQSAKEASFFPNVYGVLCGAIEGHPSKLDGARGNPGFSAVWVLESLFRTGRIGEALGVIREQWGQMLEYGPGTCWERMDSRRVDRDIPLQAPQSYCHAWTAGPAWQLPAHIAGVRCLAPGFSSVEIAPRLDSLDWVECTVPTPQGGLFVRVENRSGKYAAVVSVPAGIEHCTLLLNDERYSLTSGQIHRIN